MQPVLGSKQVFSYKTRSILYTWFSCRDRKSNKYLRETSPSTRQVFYARKGNQALATEMDLAFIIRHIRILRYFLKTVLDQDQRVLLELKSTDHIPSSDGENEINPWL